jgi:hypothetical protein
MSNILKCLSMLRLHLLASFVGFVDLLPPCRFLHLGYWYISTGIESAGIIVVIDDDWLGSNLALVLPVSYALWGME